MKFSNVFSVFCLVATVLERDSTGVEASSHNLSPRRRHHTRSSLKRHSGSHSHSPRHITIISRKNGSRKPVRNDTVGLPDDKSEVDEMEEKTMKGMTQGWVHGMIVQRDEGYGCDYGSWRCLGNELQRCFNDKFNTLRNCTDGTVCSTDASKTGCIWPWQVDDDVSGDATGSSTFVAPVQTMVAAKGVDASSSVSSSSASSQPINTVSATMTVQVASSTISVAPWYTTSSVSDVDANAAAVTSSSTTVYTPQPTVTSVPASDDSYATGQETSSSVIGNAFYGGGGWRSGRSSVTASTATDDAWAQTSGSASGSGSDTAMTATATATATSWTNTWWTPSPSAAASTTDQQSSTTVNGHHSKPTTAASHNLTSLIPTDLSTAATATATASTTASNGSPYAATTNQHYVIYSDAWLVDMPKTSAVQGYNKFILAFWLSDSGAADNAAFWESLSSDEQKTVKAAYNNAGISLMVSAFGSTDTPTTNGVDPTACANSLASWVKNNNLDGVDIDWEDNNAMNQGFAIDWLITFQTVLRAALPSPYIISHAPQAPWFTSANTWNGGYTAVHQAVGNGIDFYNVQYYNQGSDAYTTCNNLLFNSGNSFPDTSVFETNSVGGIPLDKLVIGKPIDSGAAANGYMDPGTLNECVKQAMAQGWNAGVMYWEYSSTAVGTILAVIS